ncbi:dihydrolipoyl dehydrogenase family protein [Lentibacillus sp. Marseille-P4043]|uniref:dihydrolipoyl dehydrogenase family protein n=1 Tax=Lentibacillus sp. Marseille-P4043 TaxID=2040293 RepID=UPI000D0B3E24|nr:FAD-dependent oxidoreductase [Lentibacillus sp. Marseille-P4043]
MVVGEFAEQRELIIIGGGPGGYNAAIRAAQLGVQVTLIEKAELGGVCLNKGCIPSKVHTHAAKQLASISNFKSLGISTGEASFDYDQLTKYREKTVTQLRKGVEALCTQNQIEVVKGTANFLAENRIGVEIGHRFEMFEFKHAIIATGSSSDIPERFQNHKDRLLVADTVYNHNEMPEELIVCGRDAISLEVAFSFHQLGANVSIVLDGETDFPFDGTINRELKRILKKEKINVYRGYTIDKLTPSEQIVEISLSKDGKAKDISGTHVYVETKQQPMIDSLGAERIGIRITNDGYIDIDSQMRSTVKHIFAVGDVTAGTPSALKAIKQGKVAAEIIAGLQSEADFTFIPTVVHSTPPIASVGLTETEAIEQGYNVKTSQFSHSGNSYAMIANEKNGVTKLIKDVDTDLLLGYHAIGAGAIELVNTGVTALEMVGRDEDLRFPMYPHPSFNETILEAVEGLTESAIHIPPRKKKETTL